MKISPSNTKLPMSKTIALGASILVLVASSASANITFDLRASGSSAGTVAGGGKQVFVTPGVPNTVTLQIWAQVTNAAPTNNIFGVQVILGSVKSSLTSAGVTGNVSPFTYAAPFNNQAYVGASAELSSPADTLTDLGSNATTPQTNIHIRPRKDPTSGGTQVGSVFFASNLDSNGAVFNPITNGFEFLMGTTTLSLTNFGETSSATVNWVIPPFTTAANRGQIAQWTDGDNAVNNGSGQFAEMSVGNAITFAAIPEPSAFGMMLLGAMGLVGFRRLGLRRS